MFRRLNEALCAVVARAQGLLSSDRGQTLAEYGLIITVVAVGVILPATIIFRGALVDAFDSATPCLLGSC